MGANLRRPLAVVTLAAWHAPLLWTACGGTTGREDQATTQDSGAGVGVDATLAADAADGGAPYDTGAFDVLIQYADRELPDVRVPPEGGQESTGNGLPNCPPWLSVDSMGNVVPFNDPTQVDFIPSDYMANGSIGPAAEGGVCATYPWYPVKPGFAQRWAADNAGSIGNGTINPFPPCNWAEEAGAAQAGTASGASRYDLCVKLYTCIMQSGCTQDPNVPVIYCLCGGGEAGATCPQTGANPQGPCAQQEIAGFEVPSSETIRGYVINNFTSTNAGPPVPPYINASTLNDIYAVARADRLLLLVDAGSH